MLNIEHATTMVVSFCFDNKNLRSGVNFCLIRSEVITEIYIKEEGGEIYKTFSIKMMNKKKRITFLSLVLFLIFPTFFQILLFSHEIPTYHSLNGEGG